MQAIEASVFSGGQSGFRGEGGEAVASASWLPVQACSPEPKMGFRRPEAWVPDPFPLLAKAQYCLVQSISLLI